MTCARCNDRKLITINRDNDQYVRPYPNCQNIKEVSMEWKSKESQKNYEMSFNICGGKEFRLIEEDK